MTDRAGGPRLLSGGNPQIAKGDGDGPVAAYIAAMPGWKRDHGVAIDALVTRLVPEVAKAVKWNSPFWGVETGRWFLSIHCFDRYVKATFFDGSALDPPPPERSKYPRIRYAHLPEGETLDEALWSGWITPGRRSARRAAVARIDRSIRSSILPSGRAAGTKPAEKRKAPPKRGLPAHWSSGELGQSRLSGVSTMSVSNSSSADQPLPAAPRGRARLRRPRAAPR